MGTVYTFCWWPYTELSSSTDDLHPAEGQGQSGNCGSNFPNQWSCFLEMAVNKAVGGAEGDTLGACPVSVACPFPASYGILGWRGKSKMGFSL